MIVGTTTDDGNLALRALVDRRVYNEGFLDTSDYRRGLEIVSRYAASNTLREYASTLVEAQKRLEK